MMERYKLSSIGELEPTPWDRYNKQDIPEESVEVVLAIDVQAAIDAQDQKIKELEKLAYIGEHQFPDATYKARLDELVPQYRQLEKELARVKEESNSWHMAFEEKRELHAALKQQLDTLMAEAVWAMEMVERTYCELEHTQELTIEGNLDAYKRAIAFKRFVTDWRARQEKQQ